MNKIIVALAAGAFMLGSCQQNKPIKDMLISDRDTTVNPADDFFAYANGGWIKNDTIPAEETAWGIGNLVNNEIYLRKKDINEKALKENAKTGTSQQIGDFWFAGMDTVAIEKRGISDLKNELNKINEIKTPKEVMQQAVRMQTYGVGVLFDEGVSQDLKKSDVYAYYMSQGGLGLPDRDYYFDMDARAVKIRNAYPGYIASVFELMGSSKEEAKTKAQAIVALETRMAKASRKLEDLRDPYKNYNKMAITQLGSLCAHIEWPEYLKLMGVAHVDSVIVGQPEFYKELDAIVSTENIQTLKDYLTLHLVNSFAPYLSTPFVNASFEFYSKTIRGAEKLRPRWKRVLDAEEGAMGEALGQLFVKEYFNATAKKRYEDITENMRKAYMARMEKLDWMSDSTKKIAIHKLATVKKKVGYPDKWKDFSSLKISRESYAINMMHAREWWNQYYMNKLGKPVDREEWDMTPQTYNAYYNPSNNEIVLPAGQFTVPGFRDEELDDALVYGYAAASTIGHEITHGFDDEGHQYDENGNLRNWWTDKDTAQFNKRTSVLVDQFNHMIVLDSLHINGKASLGENLADLGGILIGIDAFKQTEAYKKGEKINGLTPMQRFFLGYALGWLHQTRPSEMASRLKTDVHAPAKYRVNGPLANVPDFYDAFNVKPGNKMYLPDSLRVHLW